jgi:hypothetical protein
MHNSYPRGILADNSNDLLSGVIFESAPQSPLTMIMCRSGAPLNPCSDGGPGKHDLPFQNPTSAVGPTSFSFFFSKIQEELFSMGFLWPMTPEIT